MVRGIWLQGRYALVAVGALSLSSVAAHAEQAAPPETEPHNAAPKSGSDSLAGITTTEDAIIVTATLRARPLASVPVAVTAIAADALHDSGANDIRELDQLVPSLLLSASGSDANAAARIRGIGTVGDNPGLESSVATFIDGVYRARTGAALSELGTVERIEVLRGPQGTLFGRNASAGLINIITQKPEFRFGGSAELSYGNYDYWRAAGRVTGPVADNLAASLEGVLVKRDGFLNIVDRSGKKIGDTNDRNRYLLRGQLLFEPSDRLSVRLIGDYSKRDESCCGAVYYDTGEERGTSAVGSTSNATNRIVTILQALGTVFPNGASPYAQDPALRNISITPGRDYASRFRDWGVSGEVNYDLNDAVHLTSITAWRDYKSADYGDYDYSTADLLYRDPNTYRQFRTFSQELRLRGSAFGGLVDWLVGGYYAHEQLTLRDDIVFGADYGRFAACRLMAGSGNTASALPYTLCGVPLGTPGANIGNLIAGTQANLNAALTPALGSARAGAISGALGSGLTALAALPGGTGDTDTRYFQTSQNFAFFTHNIIHVTRRIDLTLGLRYTRETKDFSASFNNNNATCASLQSSSLPAIATNSALGSAAALAGGILTLGCLGNGSTSLNALSPRDHISDGQLSGTAVLSWKAADGLLVYASYARGYKSGGYNLDRFELGNYGIFPAISPLTYFSPRSNGDAAALRFGAETVNSYEIGLKLSKRHWAANLAAYREEFSNFQLNTFNGTSFIVQTINGCSAALSATGTCVADKVTAGLVSQGVEIELSATPSPTVRVTGGLSYTDSRFADRLVGSTDGKTPLDPALFLLPGAVNNNAPATVITASAAWTPPIGKHGLSALFYIDSRTTSAYNTGSDLYPEKAQKGYVLANARIGLRGPHKRWALEFWGRNIFNTTYTQIALNTPLQSTGPSNQSNAQLGRVFSGATTTLTNQLFSDYLAEPRTYGVTLSSKF